MAIGTNNRQNGSTNKGGGAGVEGAVRTDTPQVDITTNVSPGVDTSADSAESTPGGNAAVAAKVPEAKPVEPELPKISNDQADLLARVSQAIAASKKNNESQYDTRTPRTYQEQINDLARAYGITPASDLNASVTEVSEQKSAGGQGDIAKPARGYNSVKAPDRNMTMSECPECGKSVSSIAIACSKCGFPTALYFSSPGLLPDVAKEHPYQAVALNPETPSVLLVLLSQSEDWETRAAVAKNPAAPLELLLRLSEDRDEDVRAAVAANGNAPVSILEELADDAVPKVLYAVIDNQGAPEYIVNAANDRIASLADEPDSEEDDDYWDDDPGYYDPNDLPEGYYESSRGAFYVDDCGHECDVMDCDGFRAYYDEENSAWIEI